MKNYREKGDLLNLLHKAKERISSESLDEFVEEEQLNELNNLVQELFSSKTIAGSDKENEIIDKINSLADFKQEETGSDDKIRDALDKLTFEDMNRQIAILDNLLHNLSNKIKDPAKLNTYNNVQEKINNLPKIFSQDKLAYVKELRNILGIIKNLAER